jgi:UDP-2-acetamido-2-deoxy-ribo-hexuluronate aminotransferase
MEKIKMVDLQGQYRRIKAEVDKAIESVLMSTAFIQGPQVASFARALGAHTVSQFVIPCANGTDALQIAMMALDLRPGDEVLLPVHTYVATAEVIALLGLVPVFVEVERDSFNIDPRLIEERITARTKAIVPVHLYGQCANMEPLMAIAKKHKLHIIEDAAQALGAMYTFTNGDTKSAGTMGIIGTTSFFPSKNLGCYGDGGAIFTQNQVLAEKIQMIANHGQKKKYHHEVIGVNSRLDTLQAAILEVKLKYLDEYTTRRNSVAAYYDRELKNLKGVKIPSRSSFSTHVFHQYTLQVERRDALKTFLEENGVPTMVYYPVPLHLQNAYRRPGFGEGSFPLTENLSRTVISLPIHTEMNDDELAYICKQIKTFYS